MPDRRIAVVHQLIAVVAKHLAEIIQLRPSGVAGGARQSVLARESRNRHNLSGRQSLGRLGVGEQHRQNDQGKNGQSQSAAIGSAGAKFQDATKAYTLLYRATRLETVILKD